jgi:PhnB protein
MGSDVNDQFCAPNAGFIQGNNHYISINIEHDETEARRLFNQLSVHGHIEMQLEKLSGVHFTVLLLISSALNGW